MYVIATDWCPVPLCRVQSIPSASRLGAVLAGDSVLTDIRVSASFPAGTRPPFAFHSLLPGALLRPLSLPQHLVRRGLSSGHKKVARRDTANIRWAWPLLYMTVTMMSSLGVQYLAAGPGLQGRCSSEPSYTPARHTLGRICRMPGESCSYVTHVFGTYEQRSSDNGLQVYAWCRVVA